MIITYQKGHIRWSPRKTYHLNSLTPTNARSYTTNISSINNNKRSTRWSTPISSTHWCYRPSTAFRLWRCSSGPRHICQCTKLHLVKNTWQPDEEVIRLSFEKNWQPNGSVIRFSYSTKTTNRISPSGSHIYRSEKTPLCRRQPPKPQINYSNHQYHRLIANKHRKLLT